MIEVLPPIEEGVQETPSLRREAHYWRVMHGRAVERLEEWQQRSLHWEAVALDLEAKVGELTEQKEALAAKVILLNQQLYGRKSEQTPCLDSELESNQAVASKTGGDGGEKTSGRRRGQQPGKPGHGRRYRDHLRIEEVIHELAGEDHLCPRCRHPLREFPKTADSEEITWEVRLVRRVHRRKVYQSCCQCEDNRSLITAPLPPKVIPKGMFSSGFWSRLLMEKFLHQRPLYRVCQSLSLEGLDVSPGTLTGGLKRIGEMVQPLYCRILERARQAHHWHMDETRWLVFEELLGKSGYRWWLWVIRTEQTCCYLIDPTRSADVLHQFLPESAHGIISADRYSAYKAVGGEIQIAFCWVHVRRDFLRLQKAYPQLDQWAGQWMQRIQELFRINGCRLAVQQDHRAFAKQQKQLGKALEKMARDREEMLAQDSLHPAQEKVLTSLQSHWEGLTLFLDHPEIPMDNNEAERRLRNPVVGRKNYYGSGSIWSGALAACMFTLFQTLLIHRIHPEKLLRAYLHACGKNQGSAPPDLDPFLPWNLSQEQKKQWTHPPLPP